MKRKIITHEVKFPKDEETQYRVIIKRIEELLGELMDGIRELYGEKFRSISINYEITYEEP